MPLNKVTDLQWWTMRDPQWAAPRWARIIFVVAALGLLGMRFADRDLVPYILDEPHFQDAAWTHAHAGSWPSISPLTGNLGIAYGPAPVWFYTAVHRLVGPRPERSILAATILLSIAELLVAAALARALGGGSVLFATIIALFAASPFLFFWSRVAWEVFSGYVILAVALLATDRSLSIVRGALVGSLLGLALTSHPMSVPFVIATLTVLGWEVARRRRGAAGLAAALGSLVLVNVPYLVALHASPHAANFSWHGLGARLLGMPARFSKQVVEPARVLTTSDVDYFFDAAWPDFRAWLGRSAGLLTFGPAVALTLAVLAAAGLLWTARSGTTRFRRVARVGLLTWLGLTVLLSFLDLDSHPHYQLAAWWVVPAGIGGLAVALLPRHPRLARGLLVLVWVLAIGNASFDRAWMRWIRERGGTAGIHYSVPLAAQRALLHSACSTDLQQVAIANQTYIFPDSLFSLARTEPACFGKRLAVCPGWCPPLDQQWRKMSVRYAAYPAGKLALFLRQ